MAITADNPIYGFDSLFVGEIAPDGGFATTLFELGTTVRNSFAITSDELTTTDFFIEESDDPYISLITGGGVIRGAGAVYNGDPSMLQTLFGGTITGTGDNRIWVAPDKFERKELSIRAISENGYQVEATRVLFSPTLALNFQKENPAQINYTFTVLRPTKNGEPKMRSGKVDAFTPAG